MHRLEYDPTPNIVTLAFAERVGAAEATSVRKQIETLLPSVRTGFRLLTDLSALAEMEFECAEEIRTFMDLFHRHGVAHIVRVIPDRRKDIGFTTMSYFHYGEGVCVQTCETLAEALEALAL